MAKIDLNAVLGGHDDPRVGDEYEVAPDQWGKMKAPTIALRDKALALIDEEGAKDIDFVRLVLDGLPDFDPANAINGMEAKVIRDFFTLLAQTVKMLSQDLDQLGP
jgi:hypothetical protein